MNKTLWSLVIVVVIVAIGALVIWLVPGLHSNTAVPPSPTQTADAEQAASNLAINFGSQLQKVSVLAATSTAAKTISSTYAGYADPAIIATWMTNPSSAPGRETSSPWPDHIKVDTVTPNSNGGYVVAGNVVEMTNGGSGSSPSYADEYPVTLTVSQVNGQWLITDYQDGRDSR